MTDKQVRNYDKFMLRFPDGMRDAIAERAKSNGRSMNSEIIQILEDELERSHARLEMVPYPIYRDKNYYKGGSEFVKAVFDENGLYLNHLNHLSSTLQSIESKIDELQNQINNKKPT